MTERPELWLEQRDIYGRVGDDPRLRSAFATHLRSLHDHGTLATIARYTGR